MDKVNIAEKFALFSEPWKPKIIGELNGQYVKIVRIKDEFVWHSHEHEDEMFLVIKGKFTLELRDKKFELNEGEFFIVPKGIEHRPTASDEAEVMMFEPKATKNTGNLIDEKTTDAEWI